MLTPTHPDDLEAMESEYSQQLDVLSALSDPEQHPMTSLALGLDIPSLTAWYNTIHNTP